MYDFIQTVHTELEDKLLQLDSIVKRDIDFIEMKDKISVAIGMRRTGKTYLMLNKIKGLLADNISLSRILYIDFEDDRLQPLDQKKLSMLLDDFYGLFPENHHQTCYLFLDEIQVIPDWALVIRRFYNTKKVRIYLSGSSAKLLSKEIASSLRGRSITTEVWPFSFTEFLRAKGHILPKEIGSKKNQDMLLKYLHNYFQQGGFPGIVNEPVSNQTKILQEYVGVVIFRDIIERYGITNFSLIKYMIHYLLKNNATNFSSNKFFNDLKSQGYSIGRSTIYDYLSYIEDAYLVFTVPLYSESVRKVQTNPKKVYAIDTGMVNANSLHMNENIGRYLENCVYLDLRRRGDEIYYYLTKSRYEIDFFTRSLDGKLNLYQVAADISNSETMQREQRALTEAENELGIKGQIITLQNYIAWTLTTPLFQSKA